MPKISVRRAAISAVCSLAMLCLPVLSGLAGSVASASTPRSASPTSSVAALTSHPVPRLTSLVALARTMAGEHIPYVYAGGHGPTPGMTLGGYDCSGFVRELYYRSFGVDIGGGSGDSVRLSGEFAKTNSPVPGDLAYFNYSGGTNAVHVGVFVGGHNAAGHPYMIDAPHTGLDIQQDAIASGLLGYWHYKGATLADSGPIGTTPVPVQGAVNSVTRGINTIFFSGWSYDPQLTGSANSVAVSVDGHPQPNVSANVSRPDVDAAQHISGNHGFSGAVHLTTAGPHQLCVTGLPLVQYSTPRALGCQTVVVAAPVARGGIDFVRDRGGQIYLYGWTVDPQRPTTPDQVQIYVDSRLHNTTSSVLPVSAVDKSLGLVGNHGFSNLFPASVGQHTVCVKALPVPGDDSQANWGLKCLVVTISQ